MTADGHNTMISANGHNALQAFADGHFDLVITDQSMPLMSGVQLATAIKKISPQTPVVLLTGFGDEMIAYGNRPVGIDLVLVDVILVDLVTVNPVGIRPAAGPRRCTSSWSGL